MIEPRISVVMSVYNAEQYLRESIQSIISQTCSDFEFIIIDDGSTDSSLIIIDSFKAIDDRIIVISRENRGLVDSLNEGVRIAKGKYIARMDQDDIAFSQRFERQLEWLTESNADVCGSWIQYFGASAERVIKYPQSDKAIKSELLFGCPFAHPTVMMKRELAAVLRYDKGWEKCEDYDLWERAARAGWVMTNVPEVLLKYRLHDTQISSVSSSHQQELTQKIRRRYWIFVFDSLGLEKGWIDDVLKLREPSPVSLNMNHVDSVFKALLSTSNGETRTTIFDHATRLYFRAAATCPDIVKRWTILNKSYGKDSGTTHKIRLWFLSFFRIRYDSKIFALLKRWYFHLSRFS